MEQSFQLVYLTALIIMAILLFFCLIRAILGPKVGDRLVAVNMMGTIVMVMVCVLSLYLKEGYLVDVAIVYAMLSFLSVVLISKIYTAVFKERKIKEEQKEDNGND